MGRTEPRKRILTDKNRRLPAIEDEMEYKKNKCSSNARKVDNYVRELSFELWIDKHLHVRQQHGDDYGKREGIEPDVVQALVSKSIAHLNFYSSLVKGFNFLNHNGLYNPPIRVLLKDVSENLDIEELPLNVLIEAHAIDLHTAEITIKTALRVEQFNMSDGQYMIEFQGDNSLLHKLEGKNWRLIIAS